MVWKGKEYPSIYRHTCSLFSGGRISNALQFRGGINIRGDDAIPRDIKRIILPEILFYLYLYVTGDIYMNLGVR